MKYNKYILGRRVYEINGYSILNSIKRLAGVSTLKPDHAPPGRVKEHLPDVNF